MGGKKRIAIARLWHEGNSFSPMPTTRLDFERREWCTGAAARSFYHGTASELGGAIAFLERYSDWEPHFLRAAAAPPGGPVEQGLLDEIVAEILDGIERHGPWDGVYLSLHGALIGTEDLAPERRLLEAVRARIGHGPLAVTFDLHANLDPAIARSIDIAVGYKTYPHVDMDRAAAKALALLERAMRGEIAPVVRIAKVGAVLPSFNMRTVSGPMAEVEAEAARLERTQGLLDATPFGGFAYGDTPSAGASVVVTADRDAELAERAARELAGFVLARRSGFAVSLPDAEAALTRALSGKWQGLVAVLEPSDNPLSGGAGDTPQLFRALLARRPNVPAVFAFFWDPPLVASAHSAGIGVTLRCSLGGRLMPHYGAPIEVTAKVLKLTDGRFVNRGPMWHGQQAEVGRTALLDVDGIRVIVTEACETPNDPAYFDLHGIDLSAVRLLCVKAKNHFRAAFESICDEIIEVDTPGPAAADLAKLPFARVPPELLGAVNR